MKRTFLSLALAAGMIAAAAPSRAVTYNLTADTTTVVMPDGKSVVMWGFALGGGPVTVPGPRLTVPVGDPTLQINLTNNLPDGVSIVIPGLVATGIPAKFKDSSGRFRARSFVDEVAPGGAGTYTWSNVSPGTYLYHSGSHVQVQVQMGLYGAVTKDEASGEAYPGIMYDTEVLLLYSEVDPALHEAVSDGTYGGSPFPAGPPAFTSTINYRPEYFLVNGAPFEAGQPAIMVGAPGGNVLLRFLNAGLESHVPLLDKGRMSIVAEDGNLYPFPRDQYSAFLPAGKTRDALWSPAETGFYALLDRANSLTTGGEPGGGMLVLLEAGPTETPDLLWRNYSTGTNRLWYLAGTALYQNMGVSSAPNTDWAIVGTGYFNGDANRDILWRNSADGRNAIWYMNGPVMTSYVFITPLASLNWIVAAVADFNNNGKPDIFWRNLATGVNTIWYMNNATFVSSRTIQPRTNFDWVVGAVADMDGDGFQDTIWRNTVTGANSVWHLGATQNTLSRVNMPKVADTNWMIVAAVDYDIDGNADVIWRNTVSGAVIVWYMNDTTLLGTDSLPGDGDLNWILEDVAEFDILP